MAPIEHAYRHGFLEGRQVHGLWYVRRCLPGLSRRRREHDVPWETLIGCFVWRSPHEHRRHFPCLPQGCILYITSEEVQAYAFGVWPWTNGRTRLREAWVPLTVCMPEVTLSNNKR